LKRSRGFKKAKSEGEGEDVARKNNKKMVFFLVSRVFRVTARICGGSGASRAANGRTDATQVIIASPAAPKIASPQSMAIVSSFRRRRFESSLPMIIGPADQPETKEAPRRNGSSPMEQTLPIWPSRARPSVPSFRANCPICPAFNGRSVPAPPAQRATRVYWRRLPQQNYCQS